MELGLTAWRGKLNNSAARLDVGYRAEFAGSDWDNSITATLRWVW